MTVKRNIKTHPKRKHFGLGDPQYKSNANSGVRLITNSQKQKVPYSDISCLTMNTEPIKTGATKVVP